MMDINDLFPLYGIKLGTTKIEDVVQNGAEEYRLSAGTVVKIREILFIQPKEYDFISAVCVDCSSSCIPKKWKNTMEDSFGITDHLPLEKWLEFLRQNGKQYHFSVLGSRHGGRETYFYYDGGLAYAFSFDDINGLDRVMVFLYNCPKCSSNDVEPEIFSYICNECGYNWDIEELLDELVDEGLFRLNFD